MEGKLQAFRTAVHAQKGVAHRVSVEVADRHGVIARCHNTDSIELESTIVAAHVTYLQPIGAGRAAQDKGASPSVLTSDSASYVPHSPGVGLAHVGVGVAVAVGVGV